MIINGNYKYFDFEGNREKFVEVFTRYYGEKYRDLIKEKIYSIKYIPFYSQEFIFDYYDEYLSNFREEILEEFYKISKIERNKERDRIIFPEETISILDIASSGDFDIQNNSNLSKDYIETILDLREKIYTAFDILGTPAIKFALLKELQSNCVRAYDKIKQENKCDVFEDINTLNKNENEIMKQFLLTCYDYGYLFTDHDLSIINDPNFSINDLTTLDCNNILINDSIQLEGYVKAFTTESQKLLKNGTLQEKIEIIRNRLKYLQKNGIKLNINESLLDNYLENLNDYYNVLNEEYKYQKRHLNSDVRFDYINNINGKNSFVNGNFFPIKLADIIEKERIDYRFTHFKNCKFIKDLNLILQEVVSEGDVNIEKYTSIHNYINGKKDDIQLILFACEDEIYKKEEFLCVLMHEINHLISHNEPYKITNKHAYTKSGMDLMKFRIVEGKITNINNYKHNGLILLEENINERQTKELTNLFLEMYENPVEYSDIEIYELSDFNCNYEYYDFLTDEFYEKYREYLKEQKINPAYDIYRNKNLSTNLIFYYLTHYKNMISEKFGNTYTEDNILEFEQVSKLSRLIYFFSENILQSCQDNFITPEDLKTGENLELLTDSEQYIIKNLKIKSSNIINNASKENLENNPI